MEVFCPFIKASCAQHLVGQVTHMLKVAEGLDPVCLFYSPYFL